jgi:peroxiredoxin Q/BCP
MRLLNYTAVLFALSLGLTAAAQEPAVPAGPKPGDKAPAFSAIDQDGKPWQLEAQTGKKKYTVIYFYPGALTGGCTKQACSFRDRAAAGADIDMEVIGISGDVPTSLKVFQQVNNLNFTLLSDPDGAAAKLYGVPVKQEPRSITKQVDGKEVTLERSVTAARWTFILDREGKIIYRDTAVKAADDLNAVIAFIRKIEG